VIAVGIPSQQKCRGSVPKSFEDFVVLPSVSGINSLSAVLHTIS